MDNLEEMDKFLEIYNLPRLNQEVIDNLNRLITSSEIEFVIEKKKKKRKLPAKENLEPKRFTGEFYQT